MASKYAFQKDSTVNIFASNMLIFCDAKVKGWSKSTQVSKNPSNNKWNNWLLTTTVAILIARTNTDNWHTTRTTIISLAQLLDFSTKDEGQRWMYPFPHASFASLGEQKCHLLLLIYLI